jgi:hypothetical protein
MKPETLSWLLTQWPKGFFVEAGAHDGVGDSQTLELEKAGWDGICVEPSRAYLGLTQSRRCQLDDRPLWHCEQAVPWSEMDGEGIELSGIPICFADKWNRSGLLHTDSIKRSITLPRLLEEHAAPSLIHFLCLDTEGSEFEILSAHDFDRWKFGLAAIEHNGVSHKKDAVHHLMRSHGYLLLDYLGDLINDWYLHETIPERPQ